MDYPGLLRKGVEGAAVAEVQERLAELGYALGGPTAKSELDRRYYGLATIDAVGEFQAQNSDRQGNPLVIDGLVGPLTWGALFDKSAVELELSQPADPAGEYMRATLAVAASQVGVREQPRNSNRGPEVDQYHAAVGSQPGQAWCAAFVYWCADRAAQEGGPGEPRLVRTAWTPSIWAWARKRGTYIEPDAVLNQSKRLQPGSLLLLYSANKRRVCHVGFVEQVVDGFVHTIEGNTNKSGSAEGGGVYRLVRKIHTIYRFVNYG